MLKQVLEGHGLVRSGHSRGARDGDLGVGVEGEDLIEGVVIGQQAQLDQGLARPVQL